MIWLDKKAKWDYQYYHNDIFCSINKIQNIRAKIFIIHGTRDNTIDVRHSNLLYEKYTNFSKDNNQIWLVLVDGVGHNDIQYLIEEKEGIFFKKIQKFIDLVNYPLTLKHTAVFISHRRKNLKEQNRISFLEKEKKSLKISYDMLQINESCYKSASKAPLVSNSTNYLIDELKNKNDEHQYLCEDYETILLKLKTQSLSDQDINLTKNLHSTSLNFFFKKDEEKSRKNDWLILESVELEEVDICKKVEDFKNILSFNYFEKI